MICHIAKHFQAFFAIVLLSMYTNINGQCLKSPEISLPSFEINSQTPDNFPLDLLLLAMGIIMRNNVSEFGTKYRHGNPEHTFYTFHEIRSLSTFVQAADRNNCGDLGAWDRFFHDANNFTVSILELKIKERIREVNFLDMTFKIETQMYVPEANVSEPVPHSVHG